MTEHPSNAELELFARGAATPGEMLLLDDHLASCDACRARAATTANANLQLASLRTDYRAAAAVGPDHLTHEELAALVDGEFGNVKEEILYAHLATCAECTREENELRDFKNSIAFNLHKQYSLGAMPVVDSRWRLGGLWQAYKAWSPAWQMVVAATMVLIVATVVWLSWNARQASQQPHLARTDDVDKTPRPTANGSSVPTPTTIPDQTVDVAIALTDGGARVALNQQGQLLGLEYLSPSAQTAIKTALPMPQAKFKVLDAGTVAELQAARQQQTVSHLALGVLYARAGILEQAERELNVLMSANPESEVARKLLADVRAARRAR